MTSLSRELVFLILQFLDEEKFKETVHKYAYFFNDPLLLLVDDNRYSMKIFLIRKQKYLEALDKYVF
ncbi:hypothetical protein G4B88_029438 [Cannabis sativa]|uniref:Maturase K n=1 Tax=Cannabis sativa TaxID=3483 RepID=A0A7J6HDW8_CANSA|nr:hypothetical protein G4B88_029438 [Cannabis sativa]